MNLEKINKNIKKERTFIDWKIYVKAFISGFVFVSFIVTFIVLLAQITKNIDLLVSEITLAALIFGIWNVIYFVIKNKVKRLPIGLWGALLGFLFGIEALLRPETHANHNEAMRILIERIVNPETFNFVFHNLSIIWLPILYFLLWHYIVSWLNNLWGCKC